MGHVRLLLPGFGEDADMCRQFANAIDAEPVDYYNRSLRRDVELRGYVGASKALAAYAAVAQYSVLPDSFDLITHSYGDVVAGQLAKLLDPQVHLPHVVRLSPAGIVPEDISIIGRFIKNEIELILQPDSRLFGLAQVANIIMRPKQCFHEAREIVRLPGYGLLTDDTLGWRALRTLVISFAGDDVFSPISQEGYAKTIAGVAVARLPGSHSEAFIHPDNSAHLTNAFFSRVVPIAVTTILLLLGF